MDGSTAESAVTTTTMTKTFALPLSPNEAWDWITKADKLGKWFHPARGDFAEGEAYALLNEGEAVCWGEVLEMDPPRKLRQTFTIKPLGGVMTEVSWELTEIPGGTLIELVHSGIPAGNAQDFGLVGALDAGWDKHVASLRGVMAA